MECEIYNEIVELKAIRLESEDNIVDWFEVVEDN